MVMKVLIILFKLLGALAHVFRPDDTFSRPDSHLGESERYVVRQGRQSRHADWCFCGHEGGSDY